MANCCCCLSARQPSEARSCCHIQNLADFMCKQNILSGGADANSFEFRVLLNHRAKKDQRQDVGSGQRICGVKDKDKLNKQN